MQSDDRSSSVGQATGSKSRLFCPSCGHSDPVCGDWEVRTTADGEVYNCPDCGVKLTIRPTDRQHQPASTGDSLVARTTRLAFTWAMWPYTLPDRRTRHRCPGSETSGFAGKHGHQ
jgi:hypothetical protein